MVFPRALVPSQVRELFSPLDMALELQPSRDNEPLSLLDKVVGQIPSEKQLIYCYGYKKKQICRLKTKRDYKNLVESQLTRISELKYFSHKWSNVKQRKLSIINFTLFK